MIDLEDVLKRAEAPAHDPPPVQAVPYEFVLDSEKCYSCGQSKPEIAPDETRTVNVVPQVYFRAESAASIGGIDYSAFMVEELRVGQRQQLASPRNAIVLLERLREESDHSPALRRGEHFVPWRLDVCQPALYISMVVRNVSDRPQRFAIKLKGKAIL